MRGFVTNRAALLSAWLLFLLSLAESPAEARRKQKPPPPPPASLVSLNTHETFTLRPDPKGNFTKKQLRGWNRFMRCHHTGRVHPMAPRLARLLYQTAEHFGFQKIYLVAGYRAPRVAKKKGNPKSPHKRGFAADFRVDGVANTELRDYVRSSFERVGVGYYPNSEFVHLDVRAGRSAFWVDLSGPGQRAKYARNPNEILQNEQQAPTAEQPQVLSFDDDEAPPDPNAGPTPVPKTSGLGGGPGPPSVSAPVVPRPQ